MRRGIPGSAASRSISPPARSPPACCPARSMRRLAESGLPPERLELELTEIPAAGARRRQAAAMLRALRDRGIGLALDDFGTGYASFARLRRLPFTTLKLDHSLVAQPAGRCRRCRRSCGRSATSAGRCGLRAGGGGGGAAGAAGCSWSELGFDEAQGYLFGRPMPLEMLLAQDPPVADPALLASGGTLDRRAPCPLAAREAPSLRLHVLSPYRRHRRRPRRPEPAPAPWRRAVPPSACSTRAAAPAAGWRPAGRSRRPGAAIRPWRAIPDRPGRGLRRAAGGAWRGALGRARPPGRRAGDVRPAPDPGRRARPGHGPACDGDRGRARAPGWSATSTPRWSGPAGPLPAGRSPRARAPSTPSPSPCRRTRPRRWSRRMRRPGRRCWSRCGWRPAGP